MTKIEKLTASLRTRIHSGEWSETQALPSRMLLSKEYEVAPGTISQAFRNLEQEGLVRILPRKGVLIIDSAAATPAAPVKRAIGLRGSYLRFGVPGKESESYRGFLLNQILEAADEQGVPVLILQGQRGERPLTKEQCEAMGIQGLIYLGGDYEAEAEALCIDGFPVISANRPLGRSPLNYVDCDHVLLIQDVVRRYATVGHERIAVLIPPTHIPGLLNTIKPHFIESLLSHGIHYDVTPYWLSLDGEWESHSWEGRISALLSQPERPTALFCWSRDLLSIVLKCADACGLKVPEDMSVAYAPHSPFFSHISAFSYVNQNFGKRLFDGLMATVSNPFHFVQDEVPFEFLDQGSIAPPKAHT